MVSSGRGRRNKVPAPSFTFAEGDLAVHDDVVVTVEKVLGPDEDEPGEIGYRVRAPDGSTFASGSSLRPLVDRSRAEALLATLRGETGDAVPTAADLQARGIYDARGTVIGERTLEDNVALLRHWYELPLQDLDVAISWRTHEHERALLGEIAAALGLDFRALREEMRGRYPTMAQWEAGAAARVQAMRQAAAKPRRKKKRAPLP